ncbi:MAG TPA: acyl-CoA dehydrogenase [Bacillota bacterium]|nr:acyl-CoA dehydrogenase [Bacillota bacterium]
MTINFTHEQQMMREMVRQFAMNDVREAVDQMEATEEFPHELIKKMGQLGLMGIPIPEKYGGSGMDFTSYIIAIHELSKVSATLGVILSVHTSVGTKPILNFGTDAQKDKYLPKLATGEYLGAFALTESLAGSDAANIKTRATKDGENYILNGAKSFITNGGVANTYITFARTGDKNGHNGISAFVVEKDCEGLIVGKAEHKMGLRGSPTVELSFDHCRVHQDQLLGTEGEGYKIALAQLNVGRIGIAAQALGIAEAALEESVNYAKTREQFGKPIADQQGISFKLANMATDVEAAKRLTYHAAHLVTNEQPCAKEASMAKLFASQTAVKTAIEAVQIHGGYGYTEDYPVERFFRDAKVTEIYEGTNEIQRIVIAKQLLNH